nr:MAG TPA: hypothetical protein [Caudoviricetes sp.]
MKKEEVRELIIIAGNRDDFATLMLFAYRYALDRIPTQSMDAIYPILVGNIDKLKDFMLEQMKREIENNFRFMEHLREEGKLTYEHDCSFQKPLLDEVIKEIKRREEVRNEH